MKIELSTTLYITCIKLFQLKMLSSNCRAMHINKTNIISCNNSCETLYCNVHKYKYRFGKPENCSICNIHISDKTEIPFECGHWFHRNCLDDNIQKCLICNKYLKQYEKQYLSCKEEFVLNKSKYNKEVVSNIINNIYSDQLNENPKNMYLIDDNELNKGNSDDCELFDDTIIEIATRCLSEKNLDYEPFEILDLFLRDEYSIKIVNIYCNLHSLNNPHCNKLCDIIKEVIKHHSDKHIKFYHEYHMEMK